MGRGAAVEGDWEVLGKAGEVEVGWEAGERAGEVRGAGEVRAGARGLAEGRAAVGAREAAAKGCGG